MKKSLLALLHIKHSLTAEMIDFRATKEKSERHSLPRIVVCTACKRELNQKLFPFFLFVFAPLSITRNAVYWNRFSSDCSLSAEQFAEVTTRQASRACNKTHNMLNTLDINNAWARLTLQPQSGPRAQFSCISGGDESEEREQKSRKELFWRLRRPKSSFMSTSSSLVPCEP